MRLRRLLVTGIFLLAGCASVRLEDVTRYDSAAFPHRDPVRNAAWGPDGAPRDSYVPRPWDEIELQVRRSDGTREALAVRFPGSAQQLLHDVRAARMRVELLRALTKIHVLVAGGEAEIDTSFAAEETWGTIRSRFESVHISCAAGPCAAAVQLLPSTAGAVKPGDRLILQRSHVPFIRNVGDAPAITTESFELVVDPEGWLQIPLLARIAFSEIATSGELHTTLDGDRAADPGLRRLGGHIENSYARVRVWAPEWTGAARRTLDEIADCLNTATILPAQAGCVPDSDSTPGTEISADFVDRCIAIGVDAQFRTCPRDVSAVHYRFAPRDATWTLVDEWNGRVAVPFRHGLTVAAAVREQYPRVRGRELVLPGLFEHSAFLAVLPEPLGDERRRFYVRVVHGRALVDDPLLRPGDTVFVDRTWPERVWTSRGER